MPGKLRDWISWIKKYRSLLSLLPLGIAVFYLSINHPYLPSYPPVSGDWTVFNWLKVFYPTVVGGLFFTIALEKRDGRRKMILLASILGFLIFSFLLIIYFSVSLYFYWQESVIGRYFFPPYTSLYTSVIWRFSKPFLFSYVASLLLTSLFLLIRLIRGSAILDQTEVLTAAFIGLTLGLEKSIIALILGLIFALLFNLFLGFQGKKRVRLYQPLLVASFFSLFWGDRMAAMLFG